MLVAAAPQLSPSKLVQFLKGRSSRMLQREFPALRKRYWGQHLWARGYYCASVGAVDEKTIWEYIENPAVGRGRRRFQRDRADRALSRRGSRAAFRRLEPQPDFQSVRKTTGFSR